MKKYVIGTEYKDNINFHFMYEKRQPSFSKNNIFYLKYIFNITTPNFNKLQA